MRRAHDAVHGPALVVMRRVQDVVHSATFVLMTIDKVARIAT